MGGSGGESPPYRGTHGFGGDIGTIVLVKTAFAVFSVAGCVSTPRGGVWGGR
jgi:hypothetical protein